MYCVLYLGISQSGTLEIKPDKKNTETYAKIKIIYILRLVNNLFDFIMITIFYLFILFVKNFWDIIFMNKIGEIYSANYEFTDSEKDDLGVEYLCANSRIEGNK